MKGSIVENVRLRSLEDVHAAAPPAISAQEPGPAAEEAATPREAAVGEEDEVRSPQVEAALEFFQEAPRIPMPPPTCGGCTDAKMGRSVELAVSDSTFGVSGWGTHRAALH